MNLIQTKCPNRIALCADEQDAHSAEIGALALVFKMAAVLTNNSRYILVPCIVYS